MAVRRFTAALSAAFAGGRSSQMVRVMLDRQCVLQASRKVAVVYSRRTHASYCCTIYVHSITKNEQETSPSPLNVGWKIKKKNARVFKFASSEDIRSLMPLFHYIVSEILYCSSFYIAASFDLDGGLFSDLDFFFVGLLIDESSVVIISLVGLVKLSLTTRERDICGWGGICWVCEAGPIEIRK